MHPTILNEGSKRVSLRYGETSLVKTLDLQKPLKTHGARQIYCRVELEAGDQVSRGTVFLTAPRFMNLPRAAIFTEVEAISACEFEITVQSEGFHHQVDLGISGIPHKLDDNFFDLYPATPYRVRIRTETPTTAIQPRQALCPYSLTNTY
ncbi:MAG: glycoside hydrolase family 2 protein [Chthoniobacteraceae bacterium]